MIETTARLLQHRGYYGTPLSLILSESGAPRGSLYFHFPGGKDQLVVEATKRTIAQGTQALSQALAASETPAKAVRALFEATAQIVRDTDYTYGCPVAPIILDASGDVQALSDLCKQTFIEWVGMLRDAFAAAGIPKKRAGALALLVESSIEGLLLITRAYRATAPWLIVAAELESIVAQAIPPRRRSRLKA
jgi:TetR/AcrR family transcriptional repressor of lmrAB and yxaGH operons